MLRFSGVIVCAVILFTLSGCYSGTKPPRIGNPAPPWNRIDHPVHAGDTVSLAFDSPAGKEMTLDVAARPAGADYIQSRFKIFRP